jgi:pimeloyl-ACP methyl ester carboxylesterase
LPNHSLEWLHDLGGSESAPLLHIAHGNGFPPATYAPLAALLTDAYHVVALAARPLWPGSSPQDIETWHTLTGDLIEGLTALEAGRVIGVGHSMGGVTMLLAAVRRPDLFRAVVLLDPVLLPPRWLAVVRWIRRFRLPWHPPLVKVALRRRRVWPCREAAYEYLKGKPLFASWQDAALRAYVASGTRPTADGQVELVYPPQWEAHIFDSVPTDVWRSVPRLSPRLPVLLVRGERSTTFQPQALDRAAQLLPHARVAVIPEASHTFPLERPAEVAALIRMFLEG